MRRISRKAKINYDVAKMLPKRTVEEKLLLADVQFKSTCTRAEELREKFLKGLTEACAEKNKTTVESELKQLKSQAQQRKSA